MHDAAWGKHQSVPLGGEWEEEEEESDPRRLVPP